VEKKLIIPQICGGLGNQIFIYAMARRLSLKNNVPLKLDIISGFKKDRYQRKYLLKYFNVQGRTANPYESFVRGFGLVQRDIRKNLNKLQKFDKRTYIIEKNKCFDPKILTLEISQKVYLQGLWQSEYYFKDIENVIRHDLEITSPLSLSTIKMAERMRDVNSVSLHTRSYCEVPLKHGATTLGMDYYNKAVNIIARNVDNPHFFCFSDNPGWMKDNLKLDSPVTIVNSDNSEKETKGIEELWLMSQCQHHIIANSTFSWWGAWLNKSPNKLVIAPGGGWNNRDLIPNSWITI